jgi:multiple sugar transport system ATP-binding protein
MNFIKGLITRKDGKHYFNEGKFRVRIVDSMVKAIEPYADKEVIFGIRPEDIYDKLFVSEAPPDNTIKATCEVIEPMGSEAYLYLNTGKNPLTAKVGGHNKPTLNQDMDLVFDMSKIHFFDKDTENTIV